MSKLLVSTDWVFEGDPRPGDVWRLVGLVKGSLLIEHLSLQMRTPRLGVDGFNVWLNEAPVEVLLEQRESDALLRFRSPKAPKRGQASNPLPATRIVPAVWTVSGHGDGHDRRDPERIPTPIPQEKAVELDVGFAGDISPEDVEIYEEILARKIKELGGSVDFMEVSIKHFKFGGGTDCSNRQGPELNWKCEGPDMVFGSVSIFTIEDPLGTGLSSFRVCLEQHADEFIVRITSEVMP